MVGDDEDDEDFFCFLTGVVSMRFDWRFRLVDVATAGIGVFSESFSFLVAAGFTIFASSGSCLI